MVAHVFKLAQAARQMRNRQVRPVAAESNAALTLMYGVCWSLLLGPKIFVLVNFCVSLLTIRLIRKNCENVIYFAMICLSSYIF
jgi:hypothetical protein